MYLSVRQTDRQYCTCQTDRQTVLYLPDIHTDRQYVPVRQTDRQYVPVRHTYRQYVPVRQTDRQTVCTCQTDRQTDRQYCTCQTYIQTDSMYLPDRQTDRQYCTCQTYVQTDRQTVCTCQSDRQTVCTCQTDRQTDRQYCTCQTYVQTDRQTDSTYLTDRQTDRQTDSTYLTDRQTDRQYVPDRQTDRQYVPARQTDRQFCTCQTYVQTDRQTVRTWQTDRQTDSMYLPDRVRMLPSLSCGVVDWVILPFLEVVYGNSAIVQTHGHKERMLGVNVQTHHSRSGRVHIPRREGQGEREGICYQSCFDIRIPSADSSSFTPMTVYSTGKINILGQRWGNHSLTLITYWLPCPPEGTLMTHSGYVGFLSEWKHIIPAPWTVKSSRKKRSNIKLHDFIKSSTRERE